MGCSLCCKKDDIKDENEKTLPDLIDGLNHNEIPLLNFNGKELECYVVDVYDGDTITIVTKLKGYNLMMDNNTNDLVKFKVRMYGYDSPEMKPSKQIPEEERIKIKENANNAKKALWQKTNSKILMLKCREFDKYGRLLGELYDGNENINSWMIENGHGYEYYGGTKK